jgi:WD40 repeat protein
VWQVQFSNDGRRLASCGIDGTVIIYDVESWDVLQSLASSEGGICSLAWSPDDTMMVTAAMDKDAILWNTLVSKSNQRDGCDFDLCFQTGNIKVRLPRFGEPVSSVVWAPDGQTFITGCLDKEKNLRQWNTRGELVYDWGRSHRIQDLSVSPNGHFLVAMECETRIYVYNFVTRELEYELDLKEKLASVSISQNSRYLLAHNVAGEARMIDLDTQETVRVFKSGEKAGRFVIRAAYGGANESFVVIGSEGMVQPLRFSFLANLSQMVTSSSGTRTQRS